ncbi:MAG: hypothetical protein K2J40_07920 [Ruminococcus sp.]|nr:hypothetical protein [Ruminococcus sp.]
MTREEFEKKYDKNGMIKVSTEFPYSTVKDLMPYFEEHNNLRQNAGKEPETLEEYLEKVLTLGCKHFMLKNAEFDLWSAKTYYKKAE